MVKKKKLEIVVEVLEIESVVQILDANDVSGYTIIKDVTGKGDRGVRRADELTDVFKNSYILVVCDEEKVADIIKAIRPILKRVGGICLISDVMWLKH